MLKKLATAALAAMLLCGGAFAANHTVNQDGTVTDADTGLIWQQDEGGSMHWQAALEYCNSLSLASYSDWRLPNARELESLVDTDKHNPAYDYTVFTGQYGDFWSSTTAAGYTDQACSVDLNTGGTSIGMKSNWYLVRCVR